MDFCDPICAAKILGRALWESDAVWMIVEVLLDEEKSLDSEILERARKAIEARQRDEHEALKAAAPDLVRLDRYECRAWSRQKRAIQDFMMIKAKARSAPRIPAADEGAVCETQVLAGKGFGKNEPTDGVRLEDDRGSYRGCLGSVQSEEIAAVVRLRRRPGNIPRTICAMID